MPRISTWQRILKHLHRNLAYTEELLLQEYSCEEHDDELMYDGDDEKDCIGPVDVELLFLSTSEEIEYVQSTRYLLPRILSKTTHNIFMEDLDPYSPYRLSSRKFKSKYRCSRKSIDAIAAKIEGNPIFKSKTCQQAPAKHQLMVFLHCMGHEGQTNDNQKDVFRIGAGTC